MRRFAAVMLILSACIIGLLSPQPATAQDEKPANVKLEDVSFQEVLDQLFGTPEAPGLLAGETKFNLHADGVILTSEQISSFFVPSTTEAADFGDLIAGAEELRAELKIKGLFDDSPFELKLSGKQVKLDGLVLTAAEWDALIEQLQGISGLREAKLEATVDGRLLIAKLQNTPGRVKIEDRGPRLESENRGRGQEMRLLADNRGHGGSGRPERIEKVERLDRVERIDRSGRPDHTAIERGGPGRR